MNTVYKASGYVLGNLWGGGTAVYPARSFIASTREKLDQQINNALKDGSLDSGMGFESLQGALMVIETIETRIINGKDFTHTDHKTEIYGDINEKNQDFLYDFLDQQI